MKFIINVFTVVTLFLVVFGVRGYSQTDFKGEYTFSGREHVKGPEYGNGVPTSITIEIEKDSVIIQQGEMENGVEVKSRTAFANDGKPFLYRGKSTGRKYMRSVKWSDDKQSLTTTNEIYKAGNDDEIELTRIDEYKLAENGTQLLFHRRSVETITESWEDNATYNKN
jgi:hypothetical protein